MVIHTECPRCGCIEGEIRKNTFECPECGLLKELQLRENWKVPIEEGEKMRMV